MKGLKGIATFAKNLTEMTDIDKSCTLTQKIFIKIKQKIRQLLRFQCKYYWHYHYEYIVLLVCLFVLRFYGPVNPMGLCQALSVYLTRSLLGRLSPLSS